MSMQDACSDARTGVALESRFLAPYSEIHEPRLWTDFAGQIANAAMVGHVDDLAVDFHLELTRVGA